MKDTIIKDTKQNFNRLLIAGYVCVILLFLMLNIYTPLIADDFSMSLGINSIGDIPKAVYYAYFNWGGGIIWGVVQRLWLLIGKPLFNIANTVFYCALIFLVQFHITGKHIKQNPELFLALNVFFWFFVPAWGQDFLWLIGSIAYLWPLVAILFFLVPFRKRQDTPEYKMNMPLSVLFLFAGIFAAGGSANYGAAVLFLLIAYFVTKIIKKNKFTLFEILGAVGFLISFSFFVAGPGNYVRYDVASQNGGGFSNDPLFFMLIKRFVFVTIVFLKNHGFLFALVSVFFGFDLLYHQKRKLPVFSYFYFLAALAGSYSMLLSPTFPDRAFLITTVFSVITLGSILTQMEFRIPEILKRNIAIFAAVVLMGLCPSFLKAGKEIMWVYLQWYDRIEFILAEKEKGNLEIEIRAPIGTTDKHVAMYGLEDISFDKNDWVNTSIASYFGLKSIKCNDRLTEIPTETLMETLWIEKGKRIRQIIIPPWKIIKQVRNL